MPPKVGRSHKFDEVTRRDFFLLVDKGSSVRDAALKLGVSPDTAYMWRTKAGVSAPRRPSRKYSDEDKAEFFRRLELNRNVTAVARELGFVRVTCFKWAHEAGIYTGRDVSSKREEFLRLRQEGVPRAEAARRVGAASRSAADWDHSGGSVYIGGEATSGVNVGRWVINVVNASDLSAEATIPLAGSILDDTSSGNIEFVATSASTNNGGSERLIEVSDSSFSIIANHQVPLGFLPEAPFGNLVYGVEQSTGQVLGIDRFNGAVIVRDLLSSKGEFTPAYALCSDGASIWALASSMSTPSSELAFLDKIDPSNGSIIQQELLAGMHPNGGAGSTVVFRGAANINRDRSRESVRTS